MHLCLTLIKNFINIIMVRVIDHPSTWSSLVMVWVQWVLELLGVGDGASVIVLLYQGRPLLPLLQDHLFLELLLLFELGLLLWVCYQVGAAVFVSLQHSSTQHLLDQVVV